MIKRTYLMRKDSIRINERGISLSTSRSVGHGDDRNFWALPSEGERSNKDRDTRWPLNAGMCPMTASLWQKR